MLEGVARRGSEAGERLTHSLSGLVVWIARKHHNQYQQAHNLNDLVQQGYFGLFKAVEKFDPNIGVRLSAYVSPWVRGSISDFIRDEARPIRMPRRIQLGVAHLRLCTDELTQELGRDPLIHELAIRMDMDIKGVEELLSASQAYRCESLDGLDEDVGFMGSRLAMAVGTDAPDVTAMNRVLAERLLEFPHLTEKERLVLWRHFGFSDGIPWTLTEIAEADGVHISRVGKILERALQKLRKYLHPDKSEENKPRGVVVTITGKAQ